jgi:hypothetical protein
MGMRETEGSLRGYFLLAGLIALVLGLRDLSTATKLGGVLDELPISWKLAIWFPIIGRMMIGAGYLAAAVKLKSALQTGGAWIQNLLLGALVVLVIDAALVGAVLGTDIGRQDMISSIVGIAITAYLLTNIRRLAAEAMAKHPPARVA